MMKPKKDKLMLITIKVKNNPYSSNKKITISIRIKDLIPNIDSIPKK